MLAYAADKRTAGRTGSPRTLILILAGHAALLAAVLSAKMDITILPRTDPTDVINVPVEPPPPPPVDDVRRAPRDPVTPSVIERTVPIVPTPDIPVVPFDPGPAVIDSGPAVTPDPGPAVLPQPPIHRPLFRGPRIATSESLLRPPYPAGKQREGEEATLRLRLSIDARGRVVAVDPVGAADPAFLEAARRHIIRSWRYRPATEDGTGVASTTVITLSFRLEDA